MVLLVVVAHQEAEAVSAEDGVVPAVVEASVVDAAADSAVVVVEDSAVGEEVDLVADVVVLVVVAVDLVVAVADVVVTKAQQSYASSDLYHSRLLHHHHTRSGIVSFHLCVFVLVLTRSFVSGIRFSFPKLMVCARKITKHRALEAVTRSATASHSPRGCCSEHSGKDGRCMHSKESTEVYVLGLQCSASCKGFAAQCGTGAYLRSVRVSTKMVKALTLAPASSAAERT